MRRKESIQKTRRRLRRKRHVRRKVFGSAEQPRLTVFRSSKHISCQLVDDFRGVTLGAVSTQQKQVRDQISGDGGKRDAATVVGKLIGAKAKELGIERCTFDRNGFRFHGRVKAVAEGAREAGLKI